MRVQNLNPLDSAAPEIWGVPKFKSKSRNRAHVPSDIFCIFLFMAYSPTYVHKICNLYLKPFLRYEGSKN